MDIGDDLSLFALVVEAGGFAAASRVSGIPKSRLSRRVAELERRLGAALVKREARSFAVTDIGLKLSRHGLAIRAEVEAAGLAAREAAGVPAGPLRVACPVVLAELMVGRVAAEFAAAHPRVGMHLAVTTGMERDLAQKHDIVLQPAPGPLDDSDLVARRLASFPYVLACHPACVPRGAGPLRPIDLSGREAISWWHPEGPQRWRLASADDSAEIVVTPRFVADNLRVAREAALAGLGLVVLPRNLVARDLGEGRLVEPLPGWSPPAMTLYALYSRRSLSPAGRAFLEHLAKGFEGQSLDLS
jgi:DNA-binding transcriptional LysR family regulator